MPEQTELLKLTHSIAQRVFIVEYPRRSDQGLYPITGHDVIADLIHNEPIMVRKSHKIFTNLDYPRASGYDIAVQFVRAEGAGTLSRAEMVMNLMGFRRVYRVRSRQPRQ